MSPEYEACVRTIFYHKKGKKVENEFKAGDLVFAVDRSNSVRLGEFDRTYSSKVSQIIDSRTGECYFGFGYKATPENRQALVTLYGEDAVPKLPLRGSELTRRLLDKQKYVLCYVSDTNDGDCRENKRVSVIERFEDGYFYKGKVNGPFVCSWKYAVPVDNNGNEITEIE